VRNLLKALAQVDTGGNYGNSMVSRAETGYLPMDRGDKGPPNWQTPGAKLLTPTALTKDLG
jgi:hypothetical protein